MSIGADGAARAAVARNVEGLLAAVARVAIAISEPGLAGWQTDASHTLGYTVPILAAHATCPTCRRGGGGLGLATVLAVAVAVCEADPAGQVSRSPAIDRTRQPLRGRVVGRLAHGVVAEAAASERWNEKRRERADPRATHPGRSKPEHEHCRILARSGGPHAQQRQPAFAIATGGYCTAACASRALLPSCVLREEGMSQGARMPQRAQAPSSYNPPGARTCRGAWRRAG
jgi:hypothetical protein